MEQSRGVAFEARGKVVSLGNREIFAQWFPQTAVSDCWKGLGRLVGFEPTTSAATERRSATEL
jgi:hypothetical protein